MSGHHVHSATAAHVLNLLLPHWRPAGACTQPQWWSECTHEISRESLARRITKCRTTLGQRNERMIHPRARIEGAHWLVQCTGGQHIEACISMQERRGKAQCAAHGWRVGMALSIRTRHASGHPTTTQMVKAPCNVHALRNEGVCGRTEARTHWGRSCAVQCVRVVCDVCGSGQSPVISEPLWRTKRSTAIGWRKSRRKEHVCFVRQGAASQRKEVPLQALHLHTGHSSVKD